MNRRRSLIHLFVIGLALTTPALAADGSSSGATPIDALDGPDLFERLKSLVGEWQGEWEPGGTGTTVTYKLSGNGSVLVEDYLVGGTTMQTMYYVDGDQLILTHYCSVGNHPRMKLSSLSNDANELVFDAYDVARSTDERGFSERLTLKLIDDERIAISYRGSRTGSSSGVELKRIR